MRTATPLSREIQIADKKAKYDSSVKRLLANKVILAWILKCCVDEFRDIDVKEIEDKYIEGMPLVEEQPILPDERFSSAKVQGIGVEDVTDTERTVTFDIRFEAVVPKSGEVVCLIVNVEAQNDFYPGYPLVKRGIYYCSRMISSQYGTVFTQSHYEKLKKVYSIWICTNPPKIRANTITEYAMAEENHIGEVKELPKNYDLIAVIMICLGNARNANYEGIVKLLDVLLSSELDAEDKKKVLESDFGIPMTESLERQVSEMCNLSEGVMEKGAEKAELSAIKNLMGKLDMSAEQAMDTLEIMVDRREKYRLMIEE